MIQRIFYSYDEAFSLLGGNRELMRELVEFFDLPTYFNCRQTRCTRWDFDGLPFDSLEQSGGSERAYWTYFKGRPASGQELEREPVYHLNGWFEVHKSSALDILFALGKVNIASFVSYVEGKKHGIFQTCSEREDQFSISRSDLRFDAAKLDTFHAELGAKAGTIAADSVKLLGPALPSDIQSLEDDLDERERISMLRIIAALSKMANLKDRGGASSIKAQLEQLGFKGPGDSTIRKYLDLSSKLDPDK